MPSGVWVPAIWSKAAVNSRSEVKAVPSPNHSAVASSEFVLSGRRPSASAVPSQPSHAQHPIPVVTTYR